MQLPFVLQSAETMKAAVAHLEPHMERAGTVDGYAGADAPDGGDAGGGAADGGATDGGAPGKARIVLATVKGDVHDIGKNLVDIILTNNGYGVRNLGIKQPIDAIVQAPRTSSEAHAIGLSGLLVKSTVVMRDDLEELVATRARRITRCCWAARRSPARYVEDGSAANAIRRAALLLP